MVLTGPLGSQAALCTVHQDGSLPHKKQDLGAVSLLLTKVLTTGDISLKEGQENVCQHEAESPMDVQVCGG